MQIRFQTIVFGLLLLVSACSTEKHDEQACSPPRENWQQPVNTDVIDFPKLDVAVDRRSRIFIEGTEVSLAELANRLRQVPHDEAPTMRVFLETEMGASCDTIDSVRDTFEGSLNCRQPFRCNEGIQNLWRHWPIPPDSPPS